MLTVSNGLKYVKSCTLRAPPRGQVRLWRHARGDDGEGAGRVQERRDVAPAEDDPANRARTARSRYKAHGYCSIAHATRGVS